MNIIQDEENRIFTVDGLRYKSVTDHLDEAGFIPKQFYTERGKINGTRRHLVTELDDKDELASCAPEDMPFLVASQSGKIETGIQIIEVERRRFNHTYHYCGKPDLLVVFNGSREVWDRKTGGAEPWHRLQIGGYLGLYELPDDVFWGRCIYLQSNGTYKLGKTYGRKERYEFQAIVTVNQIREGMYHGRNQRD